MRGGEPVERLVQIHDQTVQAVAVSIGNRREPHDVAKFNDVGGADRSKFLQGSQPLFGFRAVRRVARFHGADHGDHIVPDGGT
jgi:hypothetical protein